MQLCSYPVVGSPDAPPGVFGLRSIQMASIRAGGHPHGSGMGICASRFRTATSRRYWPSVGSRWIMSPSGAGSSGSPRSWIGAADGGPMDTAPTGVPPLGLTLQRRCGWGTGFHYSLCWSRGDGSFNSTRISTLPKSMPNDLYHRQANSMRSLNWIVGANCALSSVSESGTARWCGGMRYGSVYASMLHLDA